MLGLAAALNHWILGSVHSQSSSSLRHSLRSVDSKPSSVSVDEKSSDTLIDSGTTHKFLRSRSAIIVYKEIKSGVVKRATELPKVVFKGFVKIPIGKDKMFVKSYHTPIFD